MANSIPFLGPIDLTGNELQNARLQNLTSAPPAGSGLIYYDSSTGLVGVSDGSTWKYLAKADGALDPNQVHDIVAGMLSGSSQIVSTYNSGTGTIVLTVANGAIRDANIASDANISADKIVAGASNSVFTTADETKLDGIAAQATKNQTDAYLLDRTHHTGTQTADTIVDGTTNKVYTATEKTKLAAVQAGATANQTDAYLLDRSHQTGTQTVSTISDFTTAVNSIVQGVVGAAPAALDTLQELAAALGNDANFATNIAQQVSQKADLSALATVATTGSFGDLINKPFYHTIIGNGTDKDITVTHPLGTTRVSPLMRQTAAPGTQVLCPNDAPTNSTVIFHFGTAPAAGAYEVTLIAGA